MRVGIHGAVQLQHLHAVPGRYRFCFPGRTRNLAGPRQEAQRVAARGGQHLIQCLGHRLARSVADRQRMQGTRHINHRAVAQEVRHRRRLQCRRHYQDAKVRSCEPRLASQRQTQVGVDAALVKLIDDQRGDAAQQGIILQVGRENAFSDHQQPGVSTGLLLEADVPSHLLSQRPATLVGDATRHGPSGDPARLQQQHASPVHQRGRHPRRLAGSRSRRQHRGPMAIERVADGVDERIDRKRNRRHVPYDGRP